MGMIFGFDISIMIVCAVSRLAELLVNYSATHVANKTATAIRSPYMANGLVPAFV